VIETAREHPLALLLDTEYNDSRNRPYHRAEGVLFRRGEELENAMAGELFNHAKLYSWNIRALAFIEPCRKQIWSEHSPLLSDWEFLILSNPALPSNQRLSFMKGLQAGLSGDWLVAAGLLTPRFESILRHLLEANNIDTTGLTSDLLQPAKMLGSLLTLSKENGLIDEEYEFELRGHLNEKTGYDFRNRIAHAFAGDDECSGPASVNVWWLALRMLFDVHKILAPKQAVCD
jgi:hypothetical protein